MPTEVTIRPRDIVERYHVKRATVYAWIKGRLIPHYRIGGVILLKPSDVQDFLEKFRVQAKTGSGA